MTRRHRFVPDIWNWELPGGLIEDGEPPEAAARRAPRGDGISGR
ncbi:NUDIX hydrolase [Jatrophihabitans sp. DSM 45814]